MKVDSTDVAHATKQIESHRDALMEALTEVGSYVAETQFDDTKGHVRIAGHVGGILASFAELQVAIDWRETLSKVVADKGEAATQQDVIDSFMQKLLRRTLLSIATEQSPIGEAFSKLVTTAYAQTAATLQLAERADAMNREYCPKVAASLGLEPDECYRRLRDGDELVAVAVAKAKMLDTINKYVQDNGEMPNVPAFMLTALGITEADLPKVPTQQPGGVSLNDAAARLNGDDGPRVPRFPAGFQHHATPQEGIKVG